MKEQLLHDKYEVRVNGERVFADFDLPLTRDTFWLWVEDSPGCAVELAGPDGVIDFVDEGGAR